MSGTLVSVVPSRGQPAVGDAIFCCVDSIEARAAIWRNAGQRMAFWCDGRMLGEVMSILTVVDRSHADRYAATLFSRSQAITGTCTSRGVIYTAAITAGLMTHQLARWLRGLPVDGDLTLNLLASELAVSCT
jgi:sulfur carrier protein ThiS adenylyltransferase